MTESADPKQVRDHFEEEALEYDRSILRLVPHYHEQHEILLQLLPFPRARAIRVLDLGCGTGVLTFVVLHAFPQARGVAFDLTANMLAEAGRTLARFGERVIFRQGDFGCDDLGGPFDLVVSGLAIHHLDDPGKRRLYQRIFAALAPGGVFLNREIVLGATPALTASYEQLWRGFAERSGELDETWFRNYFEEDRPAAIEDQLGWLREAGFADVGCHWQYLNFAIFGGRKPGGTD